MMVLDINKKSINEVFETSIVQQTSFWSEVKKNVGVETMAFDLKCNSAKLNVETDEEIFISDVLIVAQKLNAEHSIAYIPYGPEVEPAPGLEGVFLEQLSEAICEFLPKKCIMIRYDLLWESYWANDESFYDMHGMWLGPPDTNMQELRFNYSTHNWKFKKAFTNTLPSNTVFLNLSKSVQELLDSMKPKTRYNIKLSQRKGVQVRELCISELGVWYDLYKQTATRNGIFLHDISYFKAVVDASLETKSVEVQILVAEIDSIPLAAMFLVMSGERATYLYGASSSFMKEFMASYALQWGAIIIAKNYGCKEYDMFGVAPKPDPSHPMYGLYRFKTGFGGNIYHRLGSWDYPLAESEYVYYTAKEMVSGGYHI